jgi:regulatory protein
MEHQNVTNRSKTHQGRTDTRATKKVTSPRSVRRVAMDCLARREHSFFELKKKLQTKLPETGVEEIELEITRLRDQNLQSDRRFVEAFVRYRKSKGFGYLHIREQLRSRFVAEPLIEEYLNTEDIDWWCLINAVISKRLSEKAQLSYGGSQHQKIVRFLEGRGFKSPDIHKALAQYVS